MTNPSIFETETAYSHSLNSLNDNYSENSFYFSRVQFAHQKIYISFVIVSTVYYFFQSTVDTLFKILREIVIKFWIYLKTGVFTKFFKALGDC